MVLELEHMLSHFWSKALLISTVHPQILISQHNLNLDFSGLQKEGGSHVKSTIPEVPFMVQWKQI